MTEEGRRARRGRGPGAVRLRCAGLAPGDRTREVSVSGQGLHLKTWQRPSPCRCGPSQEADRPWAGGMNTNPSGRLLSLQQQEGRDRKGTCVLGPGDRCPRTEACRPAPKVPHGPPPRPTAPRQALVPSREFLAQTKVSPFQTCREGGGWETRGSTGTLLQVRRRLSQG